jgi:protein-S-isoprenylcysteine O-methyltransferase Ste14
MKWTRKNILLMIVLSIIGIVCFPANPLILTGVLETSFYPALFAIGCLVWAIGMMLVLSPIIMFPRRGGVPRGKSLVSTACLVNTGIYAVVRHPQYLGGILSIFVTTLLWYPHWLFAVLGVIGTVIVYLSTKDEERDLIKQFGDDYLFYMQNVPRMNLLVGIVRLVKGSEHRSGEK